MRLSGDRRSQARVLQTVLAGCPDRVPLRQAASAPPRKLASAVRVATRPLLAHAETGLRKLPGAHCVTIGSQPEPSVKVVHSSPNLVVGAGVPRLFWSVNDV